MGTAGFFVFRAKEVPRLRSWPRPRILCPVMPGPAPEPSDWLSQDVRFYNSREPGGDGSDPDVLWADDFSPQPEMAHVLHANHVRLTNGSWYHVHADSNEDEDTGHVNFTHRHDGNIFAPIDPPRAIRQITRPGFATSDWAASHGVLVGGLGVEASINSAAHNLSEVVTNVWFRYYTKPLTGYTFGAEKTLSFGRINNVEIWWGGMGFNAAIDEIRDFGVLSMSDFVTNFHMNQGNNLNVVAGNWYFIECQLKLNTPGQTNGEYRLWLDDCGPDGINPPGSPTLRAVHTNLAMDYQGIPADAGGIGSIWLENWSNPGSSGERLVMQVMAKKSGPIGYSVGIGA